MSSKSRAAIFVLALIGLGFATASSWVHYKVLTDPSYVSPCDISAAFNCTQVYLSRFGSIGGVPVALGGVFWFALVALVAAFARPTDGESVAAGYLFVIATIGLASVLYLAYASFMVLRTGCVLCIGTYVSVVGIFILTALAKPVSMISLPVHLFRDVRDVVTRPVTFVLAALLLGGTGTLMAFFPREGAAAESAAAVQVTDDARKNFETAWAQQPRTDLGIPADGAQVVIVKFNDYMCPSCRQAEMYYKPILEKYATSHPGKVKYISKDWPWNSNCNFNGQTIRGHEAACEAAAAARMGADRGKMQEMVDWLFANQGTTPEKVKEAAGRILGVTDFDREYALKLADIKRDVADGGVLRINSTPTYFINGVRLPDGMIPPEYFDLAIAIELKRQAP